LILASEIGDIQRLCLPSLAIPTQGGQNIIEILRVSALCGRHHLQHIKAHLGVQQAIKRQPGRRGPGQIHRTIDHPRESAVRIAIDLRIEQSPISTTTGGPDTGGALAVSVDRGGPIVFAPLRPILIGDEPPGRNAGFERLGEHSGPAVPTGRRIHSFRIRTRSGECAQQQNRNHDSRNHNPRYHNPPPKRVHDVSN
jgi:hypothetical protein